MIPLRDENPTRTVPFVMYGLIILNFVFFLYNGSFTEYGRNPLMGWVLVPRAVTTGADVGIPGAISPWMTLFTHQFLHANWLHIISNMLYLWIFGNNIEDVLGHFRFLVFYLLCGLAAAVLQILPSPMSPVPMLGASGAIAGILGAYIILFPRARIVSLIYFIQVAVLPASVYLGIWFIIQAFNSLIIFGAGSIASGGVAFLAHMGGFIGGVIIILVLGGKRLLRGRHPVEYGRERFSL
ncbi:MAG: rhomboid family intramembrane serine protease [Armatimonadota bacterium]